MDKNPREFIRMVEVLSICRKMLDENYWVIPRSVEIALEVAAEDIDFLEEMCKEFGNQ